MSKEIEIMNIYEKIFIRYDYSGLCNGDKAVNLEGSWSEQ